MAVEGVDLQALQQARLIVDGVFQTVRRQSLYERPIGERHRVIFYVGHVEAFDRNLMREALALPDGDARLDQLFAFGIDPPPGCLPQDSEEDWPELSAVEDYCSRVRGEIDAAWMKAPKQLRHVAIEHRLMHAETLAYMLHNFPHDRLEAQCKEDVPTAGPLGAVEIIDVPAGEVMLGRENGDGFGWDNEFPRRSLEVDAFRVDERKVTNGEYLEFVKAGGPTPHFWTQQRDALCLRRMFDVVELPLDWPVWVTQAQAAAYANWRGARLMTEAEWHLASEGADFNAANFDGHRFDPEPSSYTPSRWGVTDLCGNGWEWTSSLFRPFPGFEAFPFYPGYSANFFDDDHYVLKGASPRTDAVFTRRSFRNWFRKDYPYVFASFRCAYNR